LQLVSTKLAAASFFIPGTQVIVASGIAMQFGAKPPFSDVSVKFGGGYRYGLIGANGSGKSTFMKILGGYTAEAVRRSAR
jgi:ATPase subunit of ABC transporter with duplicated ATPase domains